MDQPFFRIRNYLTWKSIHFLVLWFVIFSTKQKDDAESSGKTEDSLYQLLQEYMLENNKLKETNRSRLTSSSLIEKLASKTSQEVGIGIIRSIKSYKAHKVWLFCDDF